jgi:6-phosphogluconolactonase
MKFSQLGQLALASAVSAALVLGITACGQSNTVDYIYVASASSNPGKIYGFAADGESGALSGIVGSPFAAGRNPIALLTSPNNKFVYALNHDDNTVSLYVAGSNGKLSAQSSAHTIQSGTNPNGMALSPDGSTLYVVEAYGLDAAGNPYSATTPGIGALVQIPVKSDGTLGTETAYPTCNNPVAVNVLASGKAVYVVNDPSGQLTTLIDTMAAVNRGATGGATVIYPSAGACLGGAGAKGQISGYTVSSNNTLTPAAGSPFSAGTAPNAITSDPSSSFLYVTDFATSQMYSYAVQTSDGALSPLANAQATGQSPSAVTTVAIAPGNKYIYVANYGANTVSGFSIGQGGTPTALPGTSNISAVDAGPASVLIENSDRYVYTANFIAGTVSSLYLDPNAGTFHPGQRTPFPGVAKATAVASVKHHTI